MTVDQSTHPIVLILQHWLLSLVTLPHSLDIYDHILMDEQEMKSKYKTFRNPGDQSGIGCEGLFILFCLDFSQLYNYCLSAD